MLSYLEVCFLVFVTNLSIVK